MSKARAEVLIAVWDGLLVQGFDGTADVVAYASQCGMPVEHLAGGRYASACFLVNTLAPCQAHEGAPGAVLVHPRERPTGFLRRDLTRGLELCCERPPSRR